MKNKSDIQDVWDLVSYIGNRYPEEDVYLNCLGELESGELDIIDEDDKLDEVVCLWYKFKNVDWWGKLADHQQSNELNR